MEIDFNYGQPMLARTSGRDHWLWETTCNDSPPEPMAAEPKARSGKIIRRISRTVAEGNVTAHGDARTLADPTVIAQLSEARCLPPLGESP